MTYTNHSMRISSREQLIAQKRASQKGVRGEMIVQVYQKKELQKVDEVNQQTQKPIPEKRALKCSSRLLLPAL